MAERPIVVGIDGTTTALRALAWAAEEAGHRQRPLRILHAAPHLGTPDDPGPRPRTSRCRAGASPQRRPSDRPRSEHRGRRHPRPAGVRAVHPASH
jgi:nucleotide-binding universal stress UspA family protein